MNDGKKLAYFGLFFIFMNTAETPPSSEGFAVQLQTCLWSEVSSWSVATTVSWEGQLVILLNISLRFPVWRFPRNSTSASRLPQKAGEWEEMVSGRKVRRWRLNGLQEEGREDYSSILLLLSEITESLRINWAQLRSKADLQSESPSPSAAAGIWTGNLSDDELNVGVHIILLYLNCWQPSSTSWLTRGLWSFFIVFVSFSNHLLVFYEDRRINLQIIFYNILKTHVTWLRAAGPG